MAIPFIPILIGSIIYAIPVLALYFAVGKSIKRLAPLVLFSIIYTVGNSIYWTYRQIDVTLIITSTVIGFAGLICLGFIHVSANGRLKSWLLASSALILCSIIPVVRLLVFIGQVSPTFFYPLITVLLAVGVFSLAFNRGLGAPSTNGNAYQNGTTYKPYSTQTELETDLAIHGRSVFSDTTRSEAERERLRQILNDKYDD